MWHSVNVIGRLRPGVELADAKADMQTIAARLASAYPATNRNVGVLLSPLREQLVGALRPAVLSLMGSVVLVLLIACANVASLLMVRATANRREVAVRQALGADRIRLFSQFLAQTLILCLLGGALGTMLAAFALPLLRLALAHTVGVDLSMVQSIQLSIPVLLFTLGTCTLTAILFGLLPVLKTSTSLADSLRPGDRGSTGRHGLSRGLLIAGEIAIAVVVLFLSTLVIRSFQKLLAVDPGFRTDHLLSLEITLPTPHYSDNGPETNRFFEQLLDRIAQSPGCHLRRKHNSGPSYSFQGDDAVPHRRSPAARTRCISSGADPVCQSGLLPHHGTWPAAGSLVRAEGHQRPNRLLHRQSGICPALSRRKEIQSAPISSSAC